MKVLIVGGGMGGPALASFLSEDARFEISLVDQAPEFKNIGFGMSIWPNGLKILEKLGLKQVIEKHGHELPWIQVESAKHRPLLEIFFSTFAAYGPTIVLPRAEIHHALIERMKAGKVKPKLNSRFMSCLSKGEAVEVYLSDGSVETYDLVVGADGIHSRVRETVFGSNFLREYGWCGWVFWASTPEFSKGIIEVPRNGSACFAFPTPEKSFMMVIEKSRGKLSGVEEQARELGMLAHLYPPVLGENILQAKNRKDFYFDQLRYVDMSSWYKGRVVLIGDAKHGASPITGMGASMALEDAWVLSEELKKTVEVEQALKAFSLRRDSRIRKFKAASHRLESWAMVSGFKAVMRDFCIRTLPLEPFFLNPIKRMLSSTI